MLDAAYSSLHPGVQKALFRLGWEKLHEIQTQSINALNAGDGHLLICAQTAGGKTEAAFLPVISRLAENPRPSVQALYIGPLIALINDQFARLERLCEDVEVPVHRWHGAASATEKRKLRDSPSGILLITPESLESNFINYGLHVPRIYAELDFIVIDEMHSFLSNVRGVHLRSLLARLSAATGRKPRIIGLSATIGDPMGARTFIAPNAPETVSIIEGQNDRREEVNINAYLRGKKADDQTIRRSNPREALDAVRSITSNQAKQEKPLDNLLGGHEESVTTSDELDDIATDILKTCVEHTNLVFGNAKQGLEILADRLHTQVKALRLQYDPFHVHHGSLSKDLREEVEVALKSGKPATVLCSSTLEMGIDIGSVRRIAQLDPPWSVASMKQRLGRSGRREGETALMRIYSRDHSPQSSSSITDLLFPNLLRSAALALLMFSKWLEPHDNDRLQLSTLVHQILSCLRQTGGMTASSLFIILVKEGAFRNVGKSIFLRVLRSLGSQGLIQQMASGEIILAPKGEQITSERDFYAAFTASEEFIVRHDGTDMGKLPSSIVPPIGENLILGGRRWRVVDIIPMTKSVYVVPATGGKAPAFGGTGGEIHTRVIEEIHGLLADHSEHPFLDDAAQMLLKAARETAARAGITSPGFIIRADSVQWFPQLGTRGLFTLELHARCDGLAVEKDALSITYKKTDMIRWREHLTKIAQGHLTAVDLAKCMPIKTFDKFDETLAEDLLDEANAHDRLDLAAALEKASKTLASINNSFPPAPESEVLYSQK
ncbi:MAG: DEAD/DEAH box helicase [Verrucomicrobiota bacterium]